MSRTAGSSSGYPGDPTTFFSATAASAACSALASGVPPSCARARIAAMVGMVAIRDDGVDMIEVSVRARDGCRIAST
jgi:hypothetical protein